MLTFRVREGKTWKHAGTIRGTVEARYLKVFIRVFNYYFNYLSKNDKSELRVQSDMSYVYPHLNFQFNYIAICQKKLSYLSPYIFSYVLHHRLYISHSCNFHLSVIEPPFLDQKYQFFLVTGLWTGNFQHEYSFHWKDV